MTRKKDPKPNPQDVSETPETVPPTSTAPKLYAVPTGASSVTPEFLWVHVDDVEQWVDNPRDNRDAIPKVAASILEFGFVAPVVVWRSRGRLVAGHTRTAALRYILETNPAFVPPHAPDGTKPGFVPVRFHEFGSEAQANAYAVADNRLNEEARWDMGKLQAVLGKLEAPMVTLTGFDPSVLAGLTTPKTSEGLPRISSTPDLVDGTDDGHKGASMSTGSARETAIRFRDYRLAMSAQEADRLTAALEDFKNRTGTYDGWVGHVLDRLS